MGEDDHDHHRQFEASPLVICLVGVMAGSIIVGILHCMMAGGWCNSSSQSQTTNIPTQRQHVNNNVDNQEEEANSTATASTSNSRVLQLIISSTYVNRYESTDVCVVCLSNFKEGDAVKILPRCAHTYHVPCIDKWLASHSSCPLCRANTATSRRGLASIPEEFRFPDFGC